MNTRRKRACRAAGLVAGAARKGHGGDPESRVGVPSGSHDHARPSRQTRMQCPDCHGTGKHEAMFCKGYMGLGDLVSVSVCSRCNGAKTVEAER